MANPDFDMRGWTSVQVSHSLLQVNFDTCETRLLENLDHRSEKLRVSVRAELLLSRMGPASICNQEERNVFISGGFDKRKE